MKSIIPKFALFCGIIFLAYLSVGCTAEQLDALQGQESEEEDPLDLLIDEFLAFELLDILGGSCNILQPLALETLFQGSGTATAGDQPAGYDPVGDQPLLGLGPETTIYLPSRYGAQPVSANEYHGNLVVESDIILSPDQVFTNIEEATDASYSVGLNTSSARWPKASDGTFRVAYSIDGSLPASTQEDIAQAIAHWQERSFFRFVQRTSESDYIYFQDNNSGCNSFVGRTGSSQAINLSENCGFGAAVHEIGHALGLWHEQSRLDRDNYIIVYSSRTTNPSQFTKKSPAEGIDLGPYDFESIMHYGSFYFQNSDLPVMTKMDGSIIEPNRRALTDCDVYGAEQLHSNASYNSAL